MDPLRPFTTLIRSLWSASGSRSTASPQTAGAAGIGNSAPATAAATITKVPALRSRLQSRLAALGGQWNPIKARELFVECILLTELGEELDNDAAFAELVQKVSAQLGHEPRISARLDEVLQDLSRGRQVT